MSSNQYIPVGLPVFQNPYPSHPYSQNFPDEPESESSQLQAPLNNPPQQYYPPNHFSGQQPAPMNHPNQFYPAGHNYHQPPQYIMVPLDPERRGLEMKISDIEKRLDSGWYFAYKVWLWIDIIGSALGVFQLSSSLIVVPNLEPLKGTPATIFTIVFLIWISWYAWILQHSLVLKNAMSDKNLKGARRGLQSMIGYSIYFCLTFIGFLGAIEYVKTTFPEDLQHESWAHYYVQAFIFLCVIPTFLKLYGAMKVIGLLAEREVLVLEFNTKYGNNYLV